MSDIEHSTDDDGDDDVGGDDDVDTPGDEKGDLSSQDCTEPPAKKRVHFADAVDIEKSTAVTVSYLYHILLVIFLKTKHRLNRPLVRVSRYQKGKTNLDFTGARDSEWQWHQLGHMQVCTSLQTDNHISTHQSVFYRPDALPAAQPTVSKH